MVTVDGSWMKKANRGVILRTILIHEYISRAEISQKTGLNKATVSVQVADLLKENVITESTPEHSSVGRKPIMLSINAGAGYVLAIDLDYHQIQFMILNLQGQPVEQKIITFQSDDYFTIIDLLVEKINQYKIKYSHATYGLRQVIVGVHGTVDKVNETIAFNPRYGWKNKNIKADLQSRININIRIENNANLAAFAEVVYTHHESTHLAAISFSSGIGGGMIIDGEVYRGSAGYAGEFAHMIVEPDGMKCPCGNKGCWGLYASEPAVMKKISEHLGKADVSYSEIAQLIEEKDPVVIAHLNDFLMYLVVGLNNIIHLANPKTVVLNSKLLELFPTITEELHANLNSSAANYRNIILSKLGNKACLLGAGALGIKHFLEIQSIYFNLYESVVTETERIGIEQN